MTDHYREAEHLAHEAARHITEHPGDMRIAEVSAWAAQAHATLALIDQLSARPHVDLTGNPPQRVDVSSFAGSATVLLDGEEVVTRKANADD